MQLGLVSLNSKNSLFLPRNISKLRGYLSNCKNQVNTPDRNIPNLYISKVGFDDFIEGLFIYPSIEDSDEFLIDFINLPSQFRLRDSSNSNFPFEFIKEEFVFCLGASH